MLVTDSFYKYEAPTCRIKGYSKVPEEQITLHEF